jgi:hypothetical protein
MPVGSTATAAGLIARNRHIALVAVFFSSLSVWSSAIAFSPNGVAAFVRPTTFAARFITIAPIAGCSAGTSGNRRINTGGRSRAMKSSPPASFTISEPEEGHGTDEGGQAAVIAVRPHRERRERRSGTACWGP